jgi:phosphopantothenoylcysteine synthetase/decarboxylase
MRKVLLVGGAPRVAIDAVRFLSVAASGATALRLSSDLRAAGHHADLLLSADAREDAGAARFSDRAELEAGLRTWIGANPDGVVVLSAAVNDYQLLRLELKRGDEVSVIGPGAKAPSGGEELVIRLAPASKIIDQLRSWGLRGPLVGFKYERRESVIASAEALLRRVDAALVVANSLCGSLQALVDAKGVHPAANRAGLLRALAVRCAELAGS